MIDTPVSTPTLGDLIRAAAADMPSDATPPQIAERVIELAGSELAHQFLLELVTATVYTRIAQNRNNSMNTAPPRSAKQARVRDWWTKFLSARVSIGEYQWKTMGTPTSAEEDDEWDDNGEICVHVLRLYESPEQKVQVEANHSPSVWRASNRGL